MRLCIAIASIISLMSCSEPPAQQASTAPEPLPPPAATEPKSEAIARADALLEDFRRRQAAQEKFDRENPPPPAPRLDDVLRSIPAPTVTPATSAQASIPPVAASTAPVTTGAPAPTRDEQWWKNEMRTAEVRLADNSRRLQEARDVQSAALRQMDAATKAGSIVFAQAQEAYNRARAETQRLEAEVRNDRAAVERVREDARRANVPPGWLRWP